MTDPYQPIFIDHSCYFNYKAHYLEQTNVKPNLKENFYKSK